MTLTDFLLARIAEDEDWAVEAARFGSDTWSPTDLARWDVGGELQPVTEAEAVHVSRHDPARVLVECEAKRRIVEEVSRVAIETHRSMGPLSDLADHVLVSLALPYADHPDYRDEWRP